MKARYYLVMGLFSRSKKSCGRNNFVDAGGICNACLFGVLLVFPFQLYSNVFPAEGSVLNYRIIGFSFPAEKGATLYTIEIAEGYYKSEDSFARNIRVREKSVDSRVIAEVPEFGKKYTWRTTYKGVKGAGASRLYHFSTIMNDAVDTSKRRLRIVQPAEKWQDAYVIVEGGDVIYDMQGNPVWCISDSLAHSGIEFKFTDRGSITFLNGNAGYDIDYNARVLWRTPRYDSVHSTTGPDYYHHDLTRLSNGHYMILGTEYLFYQKGVKPGSICLSPKPDKKNHTQQYNGMNSRNRIQMGVIKEFDEKGNLLWSWKTSDYLLASDLKDLILTNATRNFDSHDNAFFFDEPKKVIYLGFRNLSRIIKISYPDGKVLNAYGKRFTSGSGFTDMSHLLFCGQHCITLSKEGYLCVFNNNGCHDSMPPTIVMLQEPLTPKDTLKKVWEFVCPVDNYLPGQFVSGGSVLELPDSCLFICMGADYGRELLVNREKKILWSSLAEVYSGGQQKWVGPTKMYRSCIISRKDFEKMIWAAGN